jgi:hypothetical protein
MSQRTITLKIFPSSPLVLLTALMVVLKISGHLDWSWIWVFAPMWIFPAAVLGFYGCLLLFGVVVTMVVGLIALIAWIFDR